MKVFLVFMAGLLSCARMLVTLPILSQMNPDHTLFTTYFNIIFSSLYFSSSHISFGVPTKVLYLFIVFSINRFTVKIPSLLVLALI
jgi:hypothetical protein